MGTESGATWVRLGASLQGRALHKALLWRGMRSWPWLPRFSVEDCPLSDSSRRVFLGEGVFFREDMHFDWSRTIFEIQFVLFFNLRVFINIIIEDKFESGVCYTVGRFPPDVSVLTVANWESFDVDVSYSSC